MNKIIASVAFRSWLYRIFAALVAIFVGFTTWQAVTTEQWLELIQAVLGIGASAGFLLADANTPPVERDPETGKISVIQ